MRRSAFAFVLAALVVATFTRCARADDPASADAWVLSGELGIVAAYGVVAASDVPAWESARLVPGFHLGANLRTGHVSFGLHAHWASLGMFDFDELTERETFSTALTMASFGPTVRIFPIGGAFAPFFGGGPNVQLVNYDPRYGSGGSGSDVTGAGVFGELGVELFRRTHAGAMAALRVDMPFFSIEQDFRGDGYEPKRTVDRYVLPISIVVGMQLR
jgi:hypothetical protein